jgi:hypothetical protein
MSEQSTQATGTTQATGSAQPGAAPAAAPSAPAAAPAAAAPAGAPAAAAPQVQQATEGQPAGAKPADGSEGQSGTKQPQGAPEKYEFKPPQGVVLDAEVIGAFSTLAKELNLPQDAAQKVIDQLGPALAQSNAKAIETAMETQATKWASESQSDKEFGGEKLDENLGTAKKALERYASPQLRALLGKFHPKDNPIGTGLGNHPEVIRLFVKVGKAISEDKVVPGSTKPGTGAKSAAQVLFPQTH